MRILIVVHYFLPRHLAGTELYTFRLAQELQKEHEVALFYAELDGQARSYSMRTGEYEGIPFTEVVNNHSYWSFRGTYANSRIDTVFASVLDTYRPDVVHIQHLANLSLGLITLLQRRHIPIVYTLHDYWLTCPRDGLRMQKSGTLCFRVIPEQCASCMAADIWNVSPLGRLQRRLQPLWTPRPATPTTPGLLPPGVQVQTWEIDGDSRPIYAAQLPYRLRVRRRLRTPTRHETEVTVRFFFALHPVAYRSRNDGGVFKVFANGQEVFSRYLCPSRREKDRGWIEGHIVVQARKRLLLEFAAGLGPGRDPQHCIAAWGGITLSGAIIKERGERIHLWWEQGKRKVSQSLAVLNERRSLRAISRRIATVQKALTAVDLFVAPSRFLRERFIEFGVAPEKILYKDNGFDLTPLLAVQRRLRSDRRVVFAYIGTLVEHKGVHVLVEAFNRIDPALAELRVYGNPEVFPEYAARLRALATHPGIFFAGGFDNRGIGRILAEVDALVVPSLWFENSPLTIHEALLAGVPVIASNLGGMAEYVGHGRTGLLFRPGDVSDLHGQMEWFIGHPQTFAEMPRPRYPAIQDHVRELVEIYAGLQRQLRLPADTAMLSAGAPARPSQ